MNSGNPSTPRDDEAMVVPRPVCADFPDVLVSDAEALEVALREVLDGDEAVDAVMIVLREGWRLNA